MLLRVIGHSVLNCLVLMFSTCCFNQIRGEGGGGDFVIKFKWELFTLPFTRAGRHKSSQFPLLDQRSATLKIRRIQNSAESSWSQQQSKRLPLFQQRIWFMMNMPFLLHHILKSGRFLHLHSYLKGLKTKESVQEVQMLHHKSPLRIYRELLMCFGHNIIFGTKKAFRKHVPSLPRLLVCRTVNHWRSMSSLCPTNYG